MKENKFLSLCNNQLPDQRNNNTMFLSETLVVALPTDLELFDAEKSVLGKGLTFVPVERNVNEYKTKADCETFYHLLRLKNFITHVSTFHFALQFTHTISQTQMPFPDITLTISGSTISTSVHYKDTAIHNYLHYTSSHPKHCKNGIPYSQFLRLHRLCSEDDEFLQKCQEMSTFFKSRGYPSDLLQNGRQRVSSVTHQKCS